MKLHNAILDISNEQPVCEQICASSVLDPRSFHVFKQNNEHFLYDVTTGVLAELNEFSYRLLSLCGEHGWKEIQEIFAKEGLDWKPADGPRVIDDLKCQGFFEYEPIDLDHQKAALNILWNHKPRRLQLLLSQMCNLECVYCYEAQNGSNDKKRLMSFEMARQAVDYLVHRSSRRRDLQITFFGGEPLLNIKVMKKVVDYCKDVEQNTDKKFTFELITNSTLLTKDVVHYLIKNKFLLMISLDGYKEMNNFNRPAVNGEDLYEGMLENARYAVYAYKRAKTGLPVKVRANLTHEYHDLIKTIRYMEKQRFTTIGISTVDDLPWSDGNLHACTDQDREEIAVQREKLYEEGMEDIRNKKRPTPYVWRMIRIGLTEIEKGRKTRGLRCGVGRNTNIVDCDGNIYPCHRYGGMENYILGNVTNMDLDEEKTKAYYKTVNQASIVNCENCWARLICGGPCPWEVSNPNGVIHKPEDRNCDRVRTGIEKSLLFRKRIIEEAPELMPKTEDWSFCGCGPPTEDEKPGKR